MGSAKAPSTNTSRNEPWNAIGPSDNGECGMEPSDAKKLRALEAENAKLKKLLAEQMLDNAMLRDVNSKKW